jgi:hypothetical protein
MSAQGVRALVVGRISSWGCLDLVTLPRCPSEAIPMQTAFSLTITSKAEVIFTTHAFVTVVMKAVLYFRLATCITGD